MAGQSPGTVTLSMEIELGWGQPANDAVISADRTQETAALARLLDCCDANGVRMSFDVVGHLFLDSCTGTHADEDLERFDVDPAGTLESDPNYYAPDLVRMIRAANVDHEICTHTFSHVLFDEVSRATAEWELNQARAIHEEVLGRPPTSLVPPRHRTPPFDLLASNGIETVRLPHPEYINDGLGIVQRHYELDDPTERDGVTVTHCTPQPSLSAPYLANGQLDPHPVYDALPLRLRQSIHRWYLRRTVDEAIEAGATVHHWSHLYNVANDEQLGAITDFLTDVGEYVDEGRLRNCTMAELGDPCK